MQIDLETLGVTKEQVVGLLIEKLADRMLMENRSADGEEQWIDQTTLAKKLETLVREHIDERVSALSDQHVLPRISEMIEGLALQETNRWGEKTGKPVTFIEYLVQRAEFYMREEVNYNGKTKEQEGYSWTKAQTRIAHMVNQHLHYSIESAMKQALAAANSNIVKGLEETVKIKLQEVAAQMKVTVTGPR